VTLKLDIPKDLEAALLAQAQALGLSLEAYAENVLREQTSVSKVDVADASAAAAARRLGTFGKRHGLALGSTIKDLLHESRP
jgi:plasmid stability protein